MADITGDDPQSDNLTPSPHTVSPQSQAFPDSIGKRIAVPEELINAGRSTNLPRDLDSPESLDADDGNRLPASPGDNSDDDKEEDV